ncbi:MAG: Lrp/AsnC family transcriptional regulator [Euryarchaeota archaeon]|nr:Lrp/AsnC family transcriptional regulator [Euryarchaeota archaeon]
MEVETGVPKPVVDAEDRKLLEALSRDARLSHRSLAQKTGLALATVNRRVRRLEEKGVIKGYRAIVDAEAVGWTMTAIIGLRLEKGHIRQVQKAIAKDPRIFGVYDVTGEWDGVVLARVRDRADLDDLAKSTLSAPHINRTNTMVVLATVAEEAVVRVPADPAGRPAV